MRLSRGRVEGAETYRRVQEGAAEGARDGRSRKIL